MLRPRGRRAGGARRRAAVAEPGRGAAARRIRLVERPSHLRCGASHGARSSAGGGAARRPAGAGPRGRGEPGRQHDAPPRHRRVDGRGTGPAVPARLPPAAACRLGQPAHDVRGAGQRGRASRSARLRHGGGLAGRPRERAVGGRVVRRGRGDGGRAGALVSRRHARHRGSERGRRSRRRRRAHLPRAVRVIARTWRRGRRGGTSQCRRAAPHAVARASVAAAGQGHRLPLLPADGG